MLKILIVFVCRVDAVAHQHGIAPILIERIASHIVEYGVGNAFDTLPTGIDFLNSSPAVFDISTILFGNAFHHLIKFLIQFVLVRDLLFHIAPLVLQVEDNLIVNGFFVQIFVNERAKTMFRFIGHLGILGVTAFFLLLVE